MHARRRDHVAALPANVDARRERARAVAHHNALAHADVDVPPAAPGEALDRVRQIAQARAQVDEPIVAAVPRVDVDHHEPAARGDAHVRIRPPLPPPADDACVRGGVEASLRRARMLPGLRAGAFRVAAGARPVVD